MVWDQVKGNWMQAKGRIKERFGDLSDDDIEQTEGQRDKFVGMLQEKYGMAKEEAEKRADEVADSFRG